MEPTAEQWQDLLDAIALLAPDPFWTTAIPIFTTLFAVFGGFLLSQWRDSAKARREDRAKLIQEVRERHRDLVNYLVEWTHATDKPWSQSKEYAYSGAVANKVRLLVSLTGEAEDAQIAEALTGFMNPWSGRTLAARKPENELGDIEYEFTLEDEAQMEQFRRAFLGLIRRWQGGELPPAQLKAEVSKLGLEVEADSHRRSEQFAAKLVGEQTEA